MIVATDFCCYRFKPIQHRHENLRPKGQDKFGGNKIQQARECKPITEVWAEPQWCLGAELPVRESGGFKKLKAFLLLDLS